MTSPWLRIVATCNIGLTTAVLLCNRFVKSWMPCVWERPYDLRYDFDSFMIQWILYVPMWTWHLKPSCLVNRRNLMASVNIETLHFLLVLFLIWTHLRLQNISKLEHSFSCFWIFLIIIAYVSYLDSLLLWSQASFDFHNDLARLFVAMKITSFFLKEYLFMKN